MSSRGSMRGGRGRFARSDGRNVQQGWIPQAASSNQSASMNEKIVLTPSNLVTYGQRWRKETREDLLIINPRFFEAGHIVIPVSNAIDGVVPGPNGLLPMPVRPIW